MCIQKTQYSCRHSLLRMLPCGHEKKRSCFSFGSPAKEACNRRYDWALNEPCPKCRKALEDAREARELRSRGYPPSSSQRPPPSMPGGQHVGRRSHADTRALRPDSYLDPGVNAQLASLPGHYELPISILGGRGRRPKSYYDPELNAQLANLPGHYDLSSQPPAHTNRAPLSVRRRGNAPMPLSIPSQNHSRSVLEDTAVSPVSIGDANSCPVSPLSDAADVAVQSWQRSRPYY